MISDEDCASIIKTIISRREFRGQNIDIITLDNPNHVSATMMNILSEAELMKHNGKWVFLRKTPQMVTDYFEPNAKTFRNVSINY